MPRTAVLPVLPTPSAPLAPPNVPSTNVVDARPRLLRNYGPAHLLRFFAVGCFGLRPRRRSKTFDIFLVAASSLPSLISSVFVVAPVTPSMAASAVSAVKSIVMSINVSTVALRGHMATRVSYRGCARRSGWKYVNASA